MIVYRLTKIRYAELLNGIGAERYGGRWNSRGKAMIYTCLSRSLCTLEIAVHTPLGNVPTDFVLVSIECPEDSICEVDPNYFPENWKSRPHRNFTQVIGDNFLKDNQFLILKVPSAIVKDEFNLLLNPAHKDFPKVKVLTVEDFEFDGRLFG